MKKIKNTLREIHIPKELRKYYPEEQLHPGYKYASPRDIKSYFKSLANK